MRKNLVRYGTALAGIAAGTLGLAACGVDSNPYLVISAFHRLEIEDDACTWSDLPVVGGTFDAGISALAGGVGGTYTQYVRLDNMMLPTDDEAEQRLNTTWIQLTEFEISFDRTEPWGFLPESRTVPTAFVAQSESENYVPVPAFDSQLAKLMIEGPGSPIAAEFSCADLIVTYKARGVMGDGTEVESNAVDFPMTICNGAVRCPPGFLAKGCSFVQPDGFICEEPEETTP